jgi:hypothetical protein
VRPAARSASREGRIRRARKYAGSAARDISTASIAFAASYADGTEPKSAQAGAMSTGYTKPYPCEGTPRTRNSPCAATFFASSE